jgi:hypothetical protein
MTRGFHDVTDRCGSCKCAVCNLWEEDEHPGAVEPGQFSP